MKILDRYILRESLSYFLVSLSAFLGIVLIIRILRFTSLIVNKGVAVSQIAMVFLSIIPTFLEIAIPMATLLGILLAFARLSGDSEIVVIRASGISLRDLTKPVIWFGLAASIFGLVVSMTLKPWGNQKLAQTLYEIARTKTTSGLTEGVFNKLGKMTLYSEKIDFNTGDLTRVLIDDQRDELVRKIVTAKQGVIVSDDAARTITIHLKDGQIHEQVNGKYSITNFTTNSLMMSSDEMYNQDAEKKDPKLRELGWTALSELKQDYRAKLADPALRAEDETDKSLRSRIAKITIEAGRRISMPCAAIILALIAFPLGIHPPRAQKTWGAGLSLVIGLVVFVFYYGFLTVGVALGEAGRINPYIGLWVPNLVTLVVGLLMIRKIGSEQWQSIIHGIEALYDRILSLGDRFTS